MITKMTTSKKVPQRKYLKIVPATYIFGILNVIAGVDVILSGIVIIACDLPLLSSWLAPWARLVPDLYTEIKDLKHNADVDQKLFTILSDAVVIWFFDVFAPWVLIFLGTEFLLFSILLLLGISKKMVKFVMAFLIYGVISMPISILVNSFYIFLYSAKTGAGFTEYIGIYTLHIIFTIELVLAYKTIRKFNNSPAQLWHTKLEDRY